MKKGQRYHSVPEMLEGIDPKLSEELTAYMRYQENVLSLKKVVQQYVLAEFGDKCEIPAEGCPCCEAWNAFQVLFNDWEHYDT
jgi:hypothetical protein